MTSTSIPLKHDTLLGQRPSRGSAGGRLLSQISPLDTALGGGLAYGQLSEWGLTPGSEGRRVILAFLLQLASPVLWVSPDDDSQVYPPAWQAYGFDLARLYFAVSQQVMTDLRPAFLQDGFGAIVLDRPHKLKVGDLAFLCHQVKKRPQHIFILRSYRLRAERGNVFAKKRLNCWRQYPDGPFVIEGVRGLQPEKVVTDVP